MLIGKKLGMTRVFSEEGKSLPVTVIKASPCFVIDRRTEERDGYTAYVMGFGEKKEKRVKKPVLGLCKKAGVPPVEVIREFRVKDTSAFEVGEKIPVSVLEKGDKVDVVGWSKGRGFQGVVKRWGFSGGPGSHGSTFHRAPGSAGAGTFPGRVLKGKKLPGRMGNERVTVRNLEIVSLDEENGLIAVKGAVPGFTNGLLLIKISSDIDISARKELAKEKAKKAKEASEKEEKKGKVEEKATAAASEKEKETEDKSKKAKKKEEKEKSLAEEAAVAERAEEATEQAKKEEKAEAATPELKEKVEEKIEEKAEEAIKDKDEKEKVEEAEDKAEDSIEKKVEARKEEKTEETTEKAEESKEEVKNEGAKEEKADKKDQSKKKGDS